MGRSVTERSRSVAILGATGHVGRVLAAGLANRFALTLYARRPHEARRHRDLLPARANVAVGALEELFRTEHDAVVCCIGIGDPAVAVADPARVHATTLYADELLLRYLRAYPATVIVNLSSGAAYLSDFSRPAGAGAPCSVVPGSLRPADHYGIAKLASEARHRALSESAIIDLRLFSLFSRFADPATRYLMSDVVRALRAGNTLETSPDDIERDYVAPIDLCSLVAACVESGRRNDAFDVYSCGPTGKFELLECLGAEFGLRYRTTGEPSPGRKAYYSLDRSAASLGYTPTKSSLETVVEELSALLQGPAADTQARVSS